jgi:hypothetical protein
VIVNRPNVTILNYYQNGAGSSMKTGWGQGARLDTFTLSVVFEAENCARFLPSITNPEIFKIIQQIVSSFGLT